MRFSLATVSLFLVTLLLSYTSNNIVPIFEGYSVATVNTTPRYLILILDAGDRVAIRR